MAIPSHPFPCCAVPPGCQLHSPGCSGCALSWAASPGPWHFCRRCSLERCKIPSYTNGVSFVSRDVACSGGGTGIKINICVWRQAWCDLWPDTAFWPNMSWIHGSQHHRRNPRCSVHQSLFFSNLLDLCKMSVCCLLFRPEKKRWH